MYTFSLGLLAWEEILQLGSDGSPGIKVYNWWKPCVRWHWVLLWDITISLSSLGTARQTDKHLLSLNSQITSSLLLIFCILTDLNLHINTHIFSRYRQSHVPYVNWEVLQTISQPISCMYCMSKVCKAVQNQYNIKREQKQARDWI